MDLQSLLSSGVVADFGKVIAIDLMMAGDNVVVLGALAAGLPSDQRKKVITIGVGIALVFLIGFALLATQLLHVVGLLEAGGLMLLWVAWKLFRELRHQDRAPDDMTDAEISAEASSNPKSFKAAVIQVVIADLSMSLDNVLAVAGAARKHPFVLLFGLVFSVTCMGLAANAIARLIERHRWVAYLGLAMLLYVAASMIFEGWTDPDIGLLSLFT
ncbi:TerC family protein [Novosphingobium sp. G106]|uniref:TerC family protein n=1 Tax=Novosphingobium sp. G106 TaxID=2849500 RepID=UPI001C2D27A0|nr:TerC family protein [Novosphingobium sp. G106]MBV1689981.1 TerC family protein [Novosphingobium sp. G106]